MHDTSDSALLAAFRTGDREAFAVLVARHEGLVRTACLRQAPSADIEDCIQAVFLVLARRPAAAAQAPALAAWLLRVACHVSRRAQRGARRRHAAEGQAAQASGRLAGIRPEALDHLDDCIARLPERQRIAVSLHYLAQRSSDEVAAALGVNRNYAYQLVNRGLITLRGLLARRGIALSGPALLAVLASEGQAATATSPANVAQILSAAPSAGAAKLATGVTTAMTLAAPSTITMMAASLLLAAGVTTAVVTAEPERIPTPAPVQPKPAPSILDKTPNVSFSIDGAIQYTLPDERLDQLVTLDFQDTGLAEVAAFLQKSTNVDFKIDPQVAASPHPVTLMVHGMQLRSALAHIARLTGTTYVEVNHSYVFQAAGAVQPLRSGAYLNLDDVDMAINDRLAMRLTFDFQGQPLTDVISFLRQVTGVNMVVMPGVAANSSTLTLKVQNMPLKDALGVVCKLTGTSVRHVDHALLFEATGDKPWLVAPETSSPRP